MRDLVLLDRVLARVALEGEEVTPGAAAFVVRLLRQAVGPAAADAAREFRRRLQQTSGPVMAKAVEDTLFYRCNRLLALNEVGGAPERRDGSVANFHAAMAARVEAQPEGLLATATHDTKRGEDARARLCAISEAPTVWAEGVARWRAMQAPFVEALPSGPAPDPESEWLLYQALAGAWPLGFSPDDREALGRRFAAYLEKAMREAETATSWDDVNADYERAVQAYAANLLAPGNVVFREDFARTLAPFARAGALNSLAQTALKLAAPGIPDIYQGREGWDWSLVDPDNRREVDFAALSQHLAGLATASPEALLADWQDGRIKQFVLQRGLAARSRHHRLFTRGSYQPLPVSGPQYRHVVAFMRSDGPKRAIALVPRLTLRLLEDGGGIAIPPATWGETVVTLPPGIGTRRYRDIFTGAVLEPDAMLPVASLLGRFPVSLLVPDHPRG
jgi:(1->4)-alpha-D-glucan 1-alpha-D-glucosylmutase